MVLAREHGSGLTAVSTVDCPANPTYLALAPDRRTLYASHELEDGQLSAFAVGPDGALRSLGSRPGGGGLLGLGTVTTYRLDPGSGRLDAHAVAALPSTSGPRHLAFDPTDAGRAYVVNELHSTLTALAFDADAGRFAVGGTVPTLPAGVETANHPSAVLVSPDGRFVYVANRLHDGVAVFATAPALRLVATHPCGGEFPRDMALTPDGARMYVANERSGAVVGFAVDPADGSLAPSGAPLAIPGPTCVLPVDG